MIHCLQMCAGWLPSVSDAPFRLSGREADAVFAHSCDSLLNRNASVSLVHQMTSHRQRVVCWLLLLLLSQGMQVQQQMRNSISCRQKYLEIEFGVGMGG